MSVMMAKHLGPAVVFATDCRATFYRPDGTRTPRPAEDGIRKMYAWPGGVLVGTGGVELLEAVERGLRREPVTTAEQILAAIRRERHAIAEDVSLGPGVAEFQLCQTGWMLSFRAEGTAPHLWLAVYHPALGNALGGYGPGEGAVQLPGTSEAEMPQRNRLSDEMQARLLALPVCEPGASVDRAIAETLGTMRRWIAECAGVLDRISPAAQVGFHDLETGRTFVSDILQPGEPCRLPSCEVAPFVPVGAAQPAALRA